MKKLLLIVLSILLYAAVWGQDTIVKIDTTVKKPLILTGDQVLQGKSAGVQVHANSGSPGAGMDIVIRGRGSVGDSRPLYVIDGIPVGYECIIDTTEIESIEIRKSDSWNTRDKGLIIITTKQGNFKNNKPQEYEAIPKYLYGSESDFTKKIVKQLQLQATQHKIKDQIAVLCIITAKGEIHVLKTNIEKDYIFNQYLISALENIIQWYPARQNGKDVESLNMFVFDFNEE